MNDFIDKYREITDNYIEGRKGIQGKSSRSGVRGISSFVDDMGYLRNLLDDLDKYNNPKSSLGEGLSRTESKLKKYLNSIPTLWPTSGRITSDFGPRRDPFVWKQSFHDGLDIAGSYGQSIKAAASGKVIFTDYMNVYGNALIIDHGNGLTTFYGHTSSFVARKGSTVEKGDIVARVGSSGRSTGPHLHFKVCLNDTPVDPLKYLEAKR